MFAVCLIIVCEVEVEVFTPYPPCLIEGVNTTATVCLGIADAPGPFEISINIPLEVIEFVPKGKGYKKSGYGKKRGNPAGKPVNL